MTNIMNNRKCMPRDVCMFSRGKIISDVLAGVLGGKTVDQWMLMGDCWEAGVYNCHGADRLWR